MIVSAAITGKHASFACLFVCVTAIVASCSASGVPTQNGLVSQVFYVNMEGSYQQNAVMLDRIHKSKLLSSMKITRFEGVRGDLIDLHEAILTKKITQQAYNDIIDRAHLVGGHYMTEGALGCLESHVSIWKRVASSNLPGIVFEDDVNLQPGFDDMLLQALQSLPSSWGMLYLANTHNWEHAHRIAIKVGRALHYNEHLWRLPDGGHYGTYAYIITPQAAMLLLKHVHPATYQVDSTIIEICKKTGIDVFRTKRPLVATEVADSRPSFVQRKKKVDMLIPRIFHFIWIGGMPISSDARRNILKWHRMYPDWKVKIWTDTTMPALQNQVQYDSSERLDQKSDIARYELLFKYGGVYLDFDFEPLKNMDSILLGLEAFIAYENHNDTANSPIGAVQGHPFIKQLVQNLPRAYQEYNSVSVNFQTGPHYLRLQYADWKMKQHNDPNMLRAFSSHVFFPVHHTEPDFGDYNPLSYAVHHYKSSVEKAKKLSSENLDEYNFDSPPMRRI